MTENDEGAVMRYGLYEGELQDCTDILVPQAEGPLMGYEDHERIVTALRARLAAAEASRDHHKEEEEMGGRAMSQMVQDAYDIVYAGEPEDEREVRWKWVLIGMKDVKNERDQAIARLGEAEKMIASTLADIMAHPWGLHDEPVETERDALIARLQQFLSRDSAGGKS
jgi:hypothetical protein